MKNNDKYLKLPYSLGMVIVSDAKDYFRRKKIITAGKGAEDVLAEYNEADDVFCADLKELEKKAKELEEAIAMDEDQEIYKEAKQAANKDM